MSKREIGLQRMREVLGTNAEEIIKNFEQISPDFANYIAEFGYGDLYARKGISDKTREVVAVTAIITQGNPAVPLRAHLRGMLNVGWTQQEIIEVIIFLVGFIGFPPCVEAIKVAHEVFGE